MTLSRTVSGLLVWLLKWVKAGAMNKVPQCADGGRDGMVSVDYKRRVASPMAGWGVPQGRSASVSS
ncbi:hypothetical protein CC85DRAFT_287732 [Cutaneotrichosporon oleaginosum]|uniref:Uncharacterized protein n=1 Tax=Cutaneotrichosporon oleaginosum TaxID=879819 RepID=A0A0J0XGM3_9TREE|nr:uncharacterized protein CC85DRAFT_287732 [Cutaneotrichosporon oleaginosum]KLT40211.1 hypothetical protein CC85DRAFT_287732 [Cutaneotrichosporon oleaginosum]TXT10499.1 hypothetical protein COLE_04433 [Cutaneotrichosporon oleaginosum]